MGSTRSSRPAGSGPGWNERPAISSATPASPGSVKRAWSSRPCRPRPGTPRSSRPASTCISPTTGSPGSIGAPLNASTPTPLPSCSRCRRSTDERPTRGRPGHRGVVPDQRFEPRVGCAVGQGTAARRDDAPLPAATHHVPRTQERRHRRGASAAVGPLAHRRDRRDGHQPTHPNACRGLQGVARRPARTEGPAAREEHTTAPAADDPDLPRAAHRMGLARRPRPQPDPAWDIPHRTEPIPKFLTDQQAAAFMAAARAHPVARYRLLAQVLARTGLRASELCELAADAVTQIGTDGYWLRVPIGKLRNDRMIPLHPEVVDLFAEWTATNAEHIRRSRRLLADHHDPIDRRTVHRIVARVGVIAGIDDMHPHRLRHTLATQAINRGMRLEAIAALLGHRSMEMTLTYARIADRVVADEYAAVSAQIDALYGQQLAIA